MRLLPLTLLLLLAAPGHAQAPRIRSVDPFIGTRGMGHTYPGATVPFGFVQLSPDTDTARYSLDGKTYNRKVYAYCAGYQHGDPTVVGFSHTHFHGTGHSDLGDFLVMPTVGPLRLQPGEVDQPGSGYRSRHTGEQASPGYYAVTLTDPGVKAELTATSRVGVHRYTFPRSADSRIVLDMAHGIYSYAGKVLWSKVQVKSPTLVTGSRLTRGWARERHLHFAMAFSKPMKGYGGQDFEQALYKGFWRRWDTTKNFPEMAGRDLKVHFDFDTEAGEQVQVKVALSAVSQEGALRNLEAEVPHWEFDTVRRQAEAHWEQELSRVDFEGSEREKRIFYTNLYHCFLSPVIYQDVDGQYRGVDGQIHRAEGFTNHTTFSLWDTYRALHPLFTLIQQRRTGDLVNAMLAHYEQAPWKLLPVWSHHGQENWCMIGYHAVPVIVDAWMKGLRNFDGAKAWEAVKASATHPGYEGLQDHMTLGYVPTEASGSSASVTLEYSYDDWTVAQMARSLGKEADFQAFMKRAQNHRHLWDPQTRFIRARDRAGAFRTPFDPLDTHGQGYIEGNAWNYSLYMPHDSTWLVQQMGGGEAFARHLDQLFTMKLDEAHIAQTEDLNQVSLMGNYAHGNEPSHHIPYLYVWAGQPWKTQDRVRAIRQQMYGDGPDGLCGNDDAGQMAAWYIFSTLGFYPVAPGSNEYVIGAPGARHMALNLENGRRVVIQAPRLDDRNRYIQRVTVDGVAWEKPFFRHEDLMKGGTIHFEMGPKPSRWGTGHRPTSLPCP